MLTGNVEELDRLTRLIADMLFLAQADQGAAPLQHMAIDLAAKARRVADFLCVVAEERDARIEVSGEATVQGDRILIQRAITNLLSNAIRHSEAPGTLSVTLHQQPASRNSMWPTKAGGSHPIRWNGSSSVSCGWTRLARDRTAAPGVPGLIGGQSRA